MRKTTVKIVREESKLTPFEDMEIGEFFLFRATGDENLKVKSGADEYRYFPDLNCNFPASSNVGEKGVVRMKVEVIAEVDV